MKTAILFLSLCLLSWPSVGKPISNTPLLDQRNLAPFQPNRSNFICQHWQEPMLNDGQANRWYKMATVLDAQGFRIDIAGYQKKIMLYEAAAKRGHYKAIKDLFITYSEGGSAMGEQFSPEPQKARYWLDIGLKKGWVGADAWLATAIHRGYANYGHINNAIGMAYLQKAADGGDAQAQYQLGIIYGKTYKNIPNEKTWLSCSAEQNYSPATYHLALLAEIHEQTQEALVLYQQAISNGGEDGSSAARVLELAFTEGSNSQLKVTADPKRAKAYHELFLALSAISSKSGNVYYRFPRINQVLPTTGATSWKGIYSAMSPEDADFYQNLPKVDALIEEIRAAGLLVSQEYITKPDKR